MFVNYVASENGTKPVLSDARSDEEDDQPFARTIIASSGSNGSGKTEPEPEPTCESLYGAGEPVTVAAAHDPLIKIETHKDVTKFKYQGKLRSGCITCKSRKKKCDENKPVCGDCARLKIECIWEQSNMTAEEVRAIKEKLSSTIKLRKRKSATDSSQNQNQSQNQSQSHHSHSHNHSHNHIHAQDQSKRIKLDMASAGNGLHSVFDASRSYRASPDLSAKDFITRAPYLSASDTSMSSPMSHLPANGSNQNSSRLSATSPPTTHNGSTSVSSPHFPNSNMDLLYPLGGSPRLLNSYGVFAESSSRTTSGREPTPLSLDNNIQLENTGFPQANRQSRKDHTPISREQPISKPIARSDYDILQQNLNRLTSVNSPTPPPLDSSNTPYIETNVHQELTNSSSQAQQDSLRYPQQSVDQLHGNMDLFRYLSDKSVPTTPSAFWSLLKDLSTQKQHSNKIQFVDDEGNPLTRGDDRDGQDSDSEHVPLSGEFEHNQQLQEMKVFEDHHNMHFKQNGGSEKGHGDDMLSLLPRDRDMDEFSMIDFLMKNQSFADSFSNIFTPLHYQSVPLFDNMPKNSNYLYNYYVEVLSKRVSIAPVSQNESNSYQKVFLPLAHSDKSVFYAILAWSSFHLGGEWIQEGNKFVEMALSNMEDSGNSINYSEDDIRKLERNTVLHQFATLLILCGAEICRGDIRNWSEYLKWTSKLLRAQGGILNFNRTKEEHWLISNFAYHDVLASSSTVRGTYFPLETYELVFEDREGHTKGNLNPLLGISKNLYRIIGNISTLAYESTQHLHAYYNRDLPVDADASESYSAIAGGTKLSDDCDYSVSLEGDELDSQSDVSEHTRVNSLLTGVLNRAKDLEKEIDQAKPDSKDLVALTDEELELQLTLFESFQISTKLFLRQLIMKCNPSALELQILNNHLVKCIDILLGTPVMASLVFPVFIAGIHCVTQHDRKLMRNRMEAFMKLYGPWNIRRVKEVIERVWEKNPHGDNVVDWFAILKELKWDINFA